MGAAPWPTPQAVPRLSAGQTCRRCGQPVAVEVPLDPRNPPRWICPSGHSGFFHEPAVLPTYRTYGAFLPGERHGSRAQTNACSNCGEPVPKPKRKCEECRR